MPSCFETQAQRYERLTGKQAYMLDTLKSVSEHPLLEYHKWLEAEASEKVKAEQERNEWEQKYYDIVKLLPE